MRAITTITAFIVICSLVVLSIVALTPPSLTSSTTAVGISTPESLEPSPYLSELVRDLPLRSEPGRLTETVSDGMVDPWALMRIVEELAEPLGLGDWIEPLATADYSVGVPADGFSMEKIPYHYPELQWVIDAYVIPSALIADPKLVVDLSAALVVAETHIEEVGLGLTLAQILLQEAAQYTQDCDVQIQLLYAYSLGFDPDLDDMRELANDVSALCAEDPAPAWIMSQLATRLMFEDFSMATPGDALVIAEEQFASLRERFPESPLGFAGAADLRLARADEVESQRVRPFQARAWRREALNFYEQARSISDDPRLLVGHSRALTALGQVDRAAEVLELVPQSVAQLPGAVIHQVRQAQAVRDFDAVVGILSLPVGQFDPLNIAALDYVQLPSLTRLAATETLLSDAAAPEPAGGGGVVDVGFIPTSREALIFSGVRPGVWSCGQGRGMMRRGDRAA